MNQVYTHPGQDQMQVEVILASKADNGAKPIYTIRMRYPRCIHAEVETHRIMSVDGRIVEVIEHGYGIMSDDNLSRNARSSRAVPVKTMLNEVRTIPYIPWHWGKNQKGMQASEECSEPIAMWCQGIHFDGIDREQAWLEARDAVVEVAEAFMEAGYHKQNPNRLLEPFSWIDTLITSTEWDNFLWLREHEDAEPHLQDLARLVHQAIEAADVQEISHQTGYWHLPYITQEDLLANPIHKGGLEVLLKISAARCARISYKPFNGDASYEAELERYESLLSSDRIHASPLEHQATPDRYSISATSTLIDDKVVGGAEINWARPELHGNFDGWVQHRKTIPGECKTEGVL